MSLPDVDALDAAAMDRLVSGDDSGLEEIMERHAAPLFRFLCGFTGDPGVAEDLAQAAFVQLHLHRSDFVAGRRLSSWLYTIAANLARNHLRSRSRRPETSLEDLLDGDDGAHADGHRAPVDPADPSMDAVARERRREVRAAVAELPLELREAVVLCELQDLDTRTAAELLGTSPKAVESRLYRARARLRDRLRRWFAR